MELEQTFKFLGKKMAEDLVKQIKARDPTIKDRVVQLSGFAYDYYERLEDSEGPQEYAHRAILYENLGDYLADIQGLNYETLDFYHTAWNSYMLSRGHDVDARKLAEKIPNLLIFNDIRTAKYLG